VLFRITSYCNKLVYPCRKISTANLDIIFVCLWSFHCEANVMADNQLSLPYLHPFCIFSSFSSLLFPLFSPFYFKLKQLYHLRSPLPLSTSCLFIVRFFAYNIFVSHAGVYISFMSSLLSLVLQQAECPPPPVS
jgi:hypothetical protein